MAVRAYLTNGASVMLAESIGATVEDVRAKIVAAKQTTLTGSAMPDVWLKTAEGGEVAYTAILRLEPEPEPERKDDD